MALWEHISQLDIVRSGVHGTRLYNVCELLNASSSVANFLAVKEFDARVASEFIVLDNNSLKRSLSASRITCVLDMDTAGTTFTVAKMGWLEQRNRHSSYHIIATLSKGQRPSISKVPLATQC